MSASSKKKLRNELNAAKMTERQLKEQEEAKKLKLLTVSFTAVLALILVVAVVFAAVQFVSNSGIREKNTVAANIGGTELSNAQLNYYYVDAVYDFANTYGAYLSMFGLDMTKPLDEQVSNEETGTTWADDFVSNAISNAQATYALCAEAEANGFALSEEELAEIENSISQLSLYATINGYADTDSYIQAYYGPGATVESFREYTTMNALAQSYYSNYSNLLTYDDAALRAAEEGKEAEYSNFTYNYYYLNVSKFLEGGTTGEDGKTTYSDEERAAAVAKAEAVAKELAEAGFTSVEEFDAAIAALEINAEAESTPKSTACKNYGYANLTAVAKEWLTDAARVSGDMTYLEHATTSTNEDGTEEKTVNGYYIMYFGDVNDNKFPLVNVRHILVTPEGGTYNSQTGTTVYSEEEMATAKAEAEEMLQKFLNGDATEEIFIELAKQATDDPGSKENGGLYEDIYPGQMVTNFNDWCFDESRKSGDTGIVESDFGYHIMYFVSNSETIYRDFLIKNALVAADTESWYTALVEACVAEEIDTKYLSRDLVLAASN